MWTFFLYFLFLSTSIVGLSLTGRFVIKKKVIGKQSLLTKPNALQTCLIWILFYLISVLTEYIGNLIGIWTWTDAILILLHAAVWWANILTIATIILAPIGKILRYIITLCWVFLFELLQEAFVHLVTHFPLLGIPYLMIAIVMPTVCLVIIISPSLMKKIRLLTD